MDKKVKVKINIIDGFYNVFLIDILVLLFGILTVMVTQESIPLILINICILLLIIFVVTFLGCLTIYNVALEHALFSENAIEIYKYNKKIMIPKSLIVNIEYINNRWYQLPLMYFHDGGLLSITYKNENNTIKTEKIRMLNSSKKRIEIKLGYKIDIIPNKFTWTR